VSRYQRSVILRLAVSCPNSVLHSNGIILVMSAKPALSSPIVSIFGFGESNKNDVGVVSIDTLLLPTLRCRQKCQLTVRTVTMHWFHLRPRNFRLPHSRRYHPSLSPPNGSSQHHKEFPETCQPKRLRRHTRQRVNLSKCECWRWTRKLPVLYPGPASPPVDDRHARS